MNTTNIILFYDLKNKTQINSFGSCSKNKQIKLNRQGYYFQNCLIFSNNFMQVIKVYRIIECKFKLANTIKTTFNPTIEYQYVDSSLELSILNLLFAYRHRTRLYFSLNNVMIAVESSPGWDKVFCSAGRNNLNRTFPPEIS